MYKVWAKVFVKSGKVFVKSFAHTLYMGKVFIKSEKKSNFLII